MGREVTASACVSSAANCERGVEPIIRLVGKRTREELLQRCQIGAG